MNHVKQLLIFIATLTLISVFTSCEKEKKQDSKALLALAIVGAIDPSLLPAPAQNSATIIFGSDTVNSPLAGKCPDGAGDIAFFIPAGGLNQVALTLLAIDFTAGPIIQTNFVIDTSHGTYTPTAGKCEAKVLVNTTAQYDIQTLNCPVTGDQFTNPNPVTSTVSFRARCVKN